MTKRILALGLVSSLLLAGCVSENQTNATIVGAAAGATVGGLATASPGGAFVGGVAGAIAGNLVGRALDADEGLCIYERADGTRYQAACPDNM